LKHADRLSLLQELVRLGVIQRKLHQVKPRRVPLTNEFGRLVDHRQRAQTQKVDL